MPHPSRTPKVLGLAATAVLSLALAAPPALATPPPDPDPVPGLVAGRDTATPQLVTGLAERAEGSPAAAALAHLAAHPERYRIDTGQLTEVGSERTADGRHTVRFQQIHGGVPVLGGQYLVRLTGEGAGQRVESAGGKYFTGLTAPSTAVVPDAMLRSLALGALTDPRARTGATAEDRGAVVLPGGAGRLTRHFTVRGGDRAGGQPTVREVYVDATAGEIALAHDARTPSPSPSPSPATTRPAAPATTTAPAPAPAATTAAAAPALEPATGTAPDAYGRTVKVNTARLPDGSHQLVDLTRPATITTYDAGGRDLLDFIGGLPADLRPATSPTADFPAATGAGGATDAHVNAGIVYDFFRDRLGRAGLDGKNAPIVSLVNVTNDGAPIMNATWDGAMMFYGGGGPQYHSFAVALDIAGHEMTHGVIDHTAGLVNAGQTGAMNEALADYFGNAVEVTAHGVPMTDPKAALLGEALCRTGTPESCAGRRLDDRRTTVDDYLGTDLSLDSGGVHLNSTIFSGALWDIRRTLDPLTADRLVYRALAEYLTPLDDFVDGRNAVLAAGRSMNLGRAELRAVAAAFDAHGIRAGWESRLGSDSRPLVRAIPTATAAPAVAGGRWVMGNATGTGAPALYTGWTTGPATGAGAPTRLSPEDGRRHSWASTDGRSAAWLAVGPDAEGRFGTEVLTRPLAGGTVRSVLASRTEQLGEVRVSGGDIAFLAEDLETGRARILLSRDGAPPVELPLPEGHRPSGLALRDGVLGWTEQWTAGGRTLSAATARSLTADRVTARYESAGTIGSTVLAGGRLLWTETQAGPAARSAIRSGALDGSGVMDVLPADSPGTAVIATLTASDQAVTFQAVTPLAAGGTPPGGWTNAALPKLWQLPITGGTPVRVTCNRGGQYEAAADRGSRVLWLDATTGHTDLVVRDRPAGPC
ncbi:M4 family metallopeptidase [Kitasatospora sp. NBC_01560]|uniref:M4 family metallopeptidase n=1 Tax=Kitasatospora sp. NBC_01560 TaxID=2975965 RepID=UPI00386F3D3F